MPADLAVGAGTALFVAGTCFAPGEPRASRSCCSSTARSSRSASSGCRGSRCCGANDPDGYRSGFWGLARIALGGPSSSTLRARLGERRGRGGASSATIPAAAPAEPLPGAPRRRSAWPPATRRSRCSAARSSRSARRRMRTGSVSSATTARSPSASPPIQAVLGDDPRFLLSRGSHRLGFYRNFERALALAPAGASYVALADQDDAWHPDKLATLVAELGDAQLVYSDARVVDGDGRVLADSYWGRRSNNHSDLLVAAGGELGDRRRLALPGLAAARRAAVPARAVRALPRPLARARGALARRHRVRRAAALRLRPARRRDARARRREPHAGDARAAGGGAPRPARADPAVAHALLRRRLPAAAVHGDPAAAAVAADGAGQAAGARALRARRPLAPRAGGADLARRAGAAGPAPRHARRRVDARPRLRLAAAADGHRARRADPLRAARLAATARVRPAARRPCARGAGRARDRREDRAAAARGERRRAAAGQPAHPLDRPAALLRGLHRQVQPRAAAGGARRAGADRHRRPRRRAAGELAARRRGLQRPERDARRGRGRLRARVAGDRDEPRRHAHRHHVVDRAHRATRHCARSTPTASST